jgi:hypothetical protein
MKKFYMNSTNTRGIAVEDGSIVKEYGFTNVCCCEPDGFIETEKLHEADGNFKTLAEILARDTFEMIEGWTGKDKELAYKYYDSHINDGGHAAYHGMNENTIRMIVDIACEIFKDDYLEENTTTNKADFLQENAAYIDSLTAIDSLTETELIAWIKKEEKDYDHTFTDQERDWIIEELRSRGCVA